MKTIEMLKNFWHEEDGLEMVEWAMIGAFVAGIIVVAWNSIGDAVVETMNDIEGNLGTGYTPGGG
jgi:Flp pilus assembly pilin Flp